MREKLIGLLIAFVLCAVPAHAQVALVSGQIGFDDTQPFLTDGIGDATLPAPCTPGNTLLVAASMNLDRSVEDVTDDGGNTYVTDAGLNIVNGTAAEVFIYWAVCANAASTVQFNLTAASATDQGIVLIAEFSGLNNSDLLEDTDEFTDNTTPYDSGGVTTTVAHSLLFAVIQGGTGPGDYTDEAGWTTARDGGHAGLVSYKILSSTATDDWNPTSAANEDSAAAVGAFNGTVAGGVSLTCRFLTLLGVTSCR